MYTFRSTHSQHVVYVDEPRKQREELETFDWNAPPGHIKFSQEGHDEDRRPLGVYRTDNEAIAERLRALIAAGQIPAWEEDEEEQRAQSVLRKRREAVASKVAAAAAQG